MFNLEQSIQEWRKQMLAAGIKTPVPLEELENHLREEIERQMKSGLSERMGFQNAVQRIGEAKQIKTEFRKVETENGNRLLAWAAWLLFIVSFFLPAYTELADLRGWQCAELSVSAWFGGVGLDVSTIHLALLTPANLLMFAAPFLLWRFSNPRLLKGLRISNFTALILVWSYIFRCFANGGWRDLNIGCYIWAASFLLLFLSWLKLSRKTELQREQYV